MEQTSHHRDTEAQRTDKKGAFLCASVVNAIDFFTASCARARRVKGDSGLSRFGGTRCAGCDAEQVTRKGLGNRGSGPGIRDQLSAIRYGLASRRY